MRSVYLTTPTHNSPVTGKSIWAPNRGLQRFYDYLGSSVFAVLDVRREVSYINLRASLVIFAMCLWLVFEL